MKDKEFLIELEFYMGAKGTKAVRTEVSGGWLKKSYRGLVTSENFLGNFLLLIIRLYWGALFVTTGFGKWMHIQHVGEYFASLNIPYPQIAAYSIATLEILGGVSLILGLFSRLFSLLLTILLSTAYATAHKEALTHFFTQPSLFIAQEPFLYLYTALVVLCFGPGFISIDYWLEKRSFGSAL